MRDAHYMGPGAWPPRAIKKTTFKIVHSEGCIELFPGKQRGNKCITTRKQYVNMCIARNSY